GVAAGLTINDAGGRDRLDVQRRQRQYGGTRPPEPPDQRGAGVVHAAAGAGAALKTEAIPHPGVERDVDAVPVMRFATIVIGGRVVRVGRAKGAPAVAGEECDRVAASV